MPPKGYRKTGRDKFPKSKMDQRILYYQEVFIKRHPKIQEGLNILAYLSLTDEDYRTNPKYRKLARELGFEER